jgi:ABC-type transport system involved in cytochrome c biogenesis permease subunit
MIQSLSFWSATTLYALATACLFVWVAFAKPRAFSLGHVALALGLVPHAVSLGMRWLEVSHGPYSTRYEVLSANALVLAALYLGTALKIERMRPLGVFVAPAVFLMMGLAVSSYDLRYEVPIIFKSWWLYLHIGFAKGFGACTVVAAAAAIGYLLRRYRKAPPGWLPAERALDLWAHQFLIVAFLFLGVMIIAGSLWANQSWGRYWGWDPIETSSLVTWLAYGIILHFRVLHRWNGTRMAWLTLLALAFALVTLYVVAIMVPTIHNRYLVAP